MPYIPPEVLALTLVPTLALLGLTALACGWFDRCRACSAAVRERARFVAPYAGVLVVVLLFNAVVRPRVDEFAPAVGLSATGDIYALEGDFVATFQSVLPEAAILYFSAVYVVGYAVVLAFPPLAYAVLDDPRELASLLLAYAVNYALGALCYLAVVAYGPRNVFPDSVSQPLYHMYPNVMYLTSTINTNTNVFPSLHTSLAVTVLAFAYLTRDEYPRWFAIAGVLAPSVVLATMALGIHWLFDVVGGLVLAGFSVALARQVVFGDRFRPTVDWLRRKTQRQRT